jgi:hypothetical protein
LSNQKSNAYLKEIANHCNIKKNLTTHLACYTLTNGVPIETVGKMFVNHPALCQDYRFQGRGRYEGFEGEVGAVLVQKNHS